MSALSISGRLNPAINVATDTISEEIAKVQINICKIFLNMYDNEISDEEKKEFIVLFKNVLIKESGFTSEMASCVAEAFVNMDTRDFIKYCERLEHNCLY